jgi:hypothetical protein
MTILARLGTAALFVVLAVGGLSLALGPRSGGIGGVQPTPVPTPTATAPSSPARSPIPTASPNDAACRLLRSDEVGTVSGNPGLGAQPNPGGTDASPTCLYTSGGLDIQARTSLTRPGGADAFRAAKAGSGVQTVNDLGVEAVFDPVAKTLFALKDDTLVEIVPSFLAETDAERLNQAKALARLIIPRL